MRLRAAVPIVLGALLSVVGLAGCGGGDTGAAGASADPSAPLKIGVNPTPHGEILKYVADNLAKDKGLNLQITEFSDYTTLNPALVAGDLDANYFQHIPFLEQYQQDSGNQLAWVSPVHIEPLGLYSNKITSLDQLSDGATVAVPNDAANEARALKLLQDNGVLKLKDGVEEKATIRDIAENPKNLQFTELEAAQLPRSLDDTQASVINGNYAIEAGLKPSEKALALEKAEHNPYANGLVTRTELKDDPRIKNLAELLSSQQVKDFIKQRFTDGSVIPA
ncbi:MetQ/NlpA family ABC transporter substrate-binding protein [Goodfellowiella coeruleoviolacea]|uniref:Lipoprotein n=1 Tax=Goodfellowiella coeruleoviolacea TaxID=334858 RepID=A0AAE3GK00_9PSEU|nr:MetQ/NlpA family ABC transporter substrate-binding protein [Goodfellowiella coeruleoviolacea]MCP2168749.1 D-methionine transport system substrate-binding protein [Goodfellowiella coeruleoviolacea]